MVKQTTHLYFNTSHVSINLVLPGRKDIEYRNFNTSHVSINQDYPNQKQNQSVISIHLMFLLIVAKILTDAGVEIFQYISCFY